VAGARSPTACYWPTSRCARRCSPVIGSFLRAHLFIEQWKCPLQPRVGGRDRVHHDHALDLIRVATPVELDEETAVPVARENVWARYIGRLKQLMKIADDTGSGSWRGCRITRSDVGSVIINEDQSSHESSLGLPLCLPLTVWATALP
jgi:hypothetical protein